MPILDHSNKKLRADFDSFHSSWMVHIADHLNEILPRRFVARARAKIGVREVDVRTDELLTEEEKTQFSLYQPPQPSSPGIKATFPTELEVFVKYIEREEERTVGVIEIVSPRNKDRPQARDTFVAKCSNLLSEGISLIIIDILPVPSFNLHNQLLLALEGTEGYLKEDKDRPLYCTAYRQTFIFEEEEAPAIDCWAHALKVSDTLPELPLFITSECAVPVDLEKTYMETCWKSRMLR
ncbi:MAG: DUF4058 family protein [Candidatus Poribacteria bacterium]